MISSGFQQEEAAAAAIQDLELSRLVRRLVAEDGLDSQDAALAAIAEYKKFLHLATLHPGPLQPPAAVDVVWQRHLLDTKAYEADCAAIFGRYAHRVYMYGAAGESEEIAAASQMKSLARTSALLELEFGTVDSDIWGFTPLHSVGIDLTPPPVRSSGAHLTKIEDEDLAWLGAAVAIELPLKQSNCRKKEPLAQIAIDEPAATVEEYKRFLRLMVDHDGGYYTPSKLVDEL